MIQSESIAAYLLDTMQHMGAYHNAFSSSEILEEYKLKHGAMYRSILQGVITRLRNDGYIKTVIRRAVGSLPNLPGLSNPNCSVKYKLTKDGLTELERLNQEDIPDTEDLSLA